jgi:hypothetical protein
MKILKYIFLFLLASINSLEATSGYKLVLNDAQSTLDGTTLSSTEVNGVTYSDGTVKITNEGTYILSGTLNGQVKVSSTGTVKLVLNGVTINNSASNGILFTKAYELDSSTFNYNTASKLDITKAGAQIIIADGTENTVNAASQSGKDGAIHSDVSILITGESKGDGILNVIGSSEGIETDKHFFMNGGILKIAAQDDAINASNDNACIVIIRGGKVLINSGLGREGDGVDSNGYILVDGGEVISAARPGADSGLDADQATIINGGTVYSVGSSMDMASTSSGQPTMNLIFNSNVAASSTVTIKDSDGNTIMSYCANSADFISGTERRTYLAAVVSHPSFKANGVYHLYMDGTQLGYTGNEGGHGPGGQGGPGGPGGWGPGSSSSSSSSSGEIKTDFTLGSSATNFSGVQKAL